MFQDPRPQDPKPTSAPSLPAIDPPWMQSDGGAETVAPWGMLGRDLSEEAGGWEYAGIGALAAAKGVADGAVNIASLLHRASSSVAYGVSGNGFGEGWNQVGRHYQSYYGTDNPSIVDLFPGRDAASQEPSVGQNADAFLQKRLGQSKIAWDAAGMVGSFMIPGGPVGKGAAAVARPMAQVGSNAIAKMAMRGMPKEIIESAISTGNVWQHLARNPGLARSTGLMDDMLQGVGRNFSEMMEVGAANIAQAYALAPDDERTNAAKAAFLTAPLAVPLARLGEKLGAMTMQLGMSPERARALRGAYDEFANGQIGPKVLRERIAAQIPAAQRAMANMGVANAFETTAFMGMDPNMWPDVQKALGGDGDAIGKVAMMWLGTFAGSAVVKGTMPPDLAPMFKSFRPDLNTLDLYIERDAIRRAGAQKAVEPAAPRPQVNPGEELANQAEMHVTEGQWEALQNRGPLHGAQPDASNPYTDAIVDGRTRYGWATGPTLAALQGDWAPSFPSDTGTDVHLTYGGTNSVFLGRGEGGELHLQVSDATKRVMRSYGLSDGQATGTAHYDYRGPDAARALDDLATIGATRRMQADSEFERLGFNFMEGRWYDHDGLRVEPLLEGGYARFDVDGTKVDERQTTVVGYGPDAPVWGDHPNIDAFEMALAQKASLSPDPMVDATLRTALNRARYGTTEGADRLRSFFKTADPELLRAHLNPNDDRALAFNLAALGAGNEMPASVLGEIQTLGEARRQQAEMLNEQSAGTAPPRDVSDEGPFPPRNEAGEDEAARIQEMRGRIERGRRQVGAPDDLSAWAEAVATNSADQGDVAATTVGVVTPRDVATTLRKYAPKGSRLHEQAEKADSSAMEVDALTLAQAIRNYRPRAGKEGNAAHFEAWLRKAAKAVESRVLQARAGDQKWVRDLAGLIDPDVTESVSSRLAARRKKEGGFVDVGFLGDAVRGAKLLAKDVATTVKDMWRRRRKSGARDYAIEHQADVLTRIAPDDQLGFQARSVNAMAAKLRGESRDEWRPAEKALRKNKQITEGLVELSPRSREPVWRGLADADRTPQGEAERDVRDAFQAAGSKMWDEGVNAGVFGTRNVDGEARLEPMTKRDGPSKIERSVGKDMDIVLNDPQSRKEWWQENLDLNPNDPNLVRTVTEKDGSKSKRRLTADDIEKLWQEQFDVGGGKKIDREAAFEFQRMFQKTPYQWKDSHGIWRETYETNPFIVMERATAKQSARAASVRELGQNFSPEERAAIKAAADRGDIVLSPENLANLERGGPTAALQRLSKKLAADARVNIHESVMETATNLVSRMQGVEPIDPTRLAKSLQGISSFTSSMLAAAAWVRDIPDLLVRNPVYGGAWRAAKAFAEVSASPREMYQWATRVGAVERDLGDYVVSEAKTWIHKLQNAAGWLGGKSEQFKGVVAARIAELVIRDVKAGKATMNDLQVAQDLLRLSGEQVQALREGRLSPELETQYRRELTQAMTSKTRPSEGSAFAASPNVKALVLFARFATNRLNSHVRMYASLGRAVQRDGWASKGAVIAARRILAHTTGIAIGGLLGNALAATIVGTLQGEPWDEGIGKLWHKLTASGTDGVLTTLDASLNQVVGGPFGAMISAAANSDDARSWTRMTVPTNLAHSAINAGAAIVGGDLYGLWNSVGQAGAVPFRQEVNAAANVVGHWMMPGAIATPQMRADLRFAREFMRDEDITIPHGQRNKPDEFYDAIGEAALAVGRAKDAKEAMAMASEAIAKALELAPKDSVAASIEGHQIIKNLTDDQREALAARTSVERMNRYYEHDAMLREMAKLIRRGSEGVNPTPWEQQLEAVVAQASMGGSDRWAGLVDRAMDETAHRIAAKEGMGDQIDEVAEKLALYPTHAAKVFDEKLMKSIMAPNLTTLQRARRISAMLKSRLSARVKNIYKDRAEARRGN